MYRSVSTIVLRIYVCACIYVFFNIFNISIANSIK